MNTSFLTAVVVGLAIVTGIFFCIYGIVMATKDEMAERRRIREAGK